MATLNRAEALGVLPDPRVAGKNLHRQDERAFLAIRAVISGAREWSGSVASEVVKKPSRAPRGQGARRAGTAVYVQ